MKVNDNTASLFANTQLLDGMKQLDKSLARLASGHRINQAADDASGMAVADQLGSQARGIGQALRNANDAISMAQIADGALGEATGIIQDIRTKSLQAANASQSPESRQAIQADIDKLTAQLNNIAQTTSFNGQKLLSGTFIDTGFQIGAYAGETAELSIESAEPSNVGGSPFGTLSQINVLTEEGAQNAIQITDTALEDLNGIRSTIGSFQNQMQTTIANLASSQINLLSAESGIRDVDFAEEAMNFSKMNALTKARTFAASQSNANSKNVLNILNA